MPLGKLFSVINLFSVISQIVLQGIFQVSLFYLLQRQNWFEKWEVSEDELSGQENTTVFLFSCTQYIFIVISFSIDNLYRKAFWTNKPLVFSLLMVGILTFGMILSPPKFVAEVMELVHIPTYWTRVI